MMTRDSGIKATGYDKYINYKIFSVAIGLFTILLVVPIPSSMLDVGVEYAMGETYVLNLYSQELFGKPYSEVEQWQALLGLGSVVTAVMTNLMADGPAAAAVGPIALNMAAISSPGTTLMPFMGLSTAAASSFAYLLVIGTPPNAIVYASGLLQPKDFLRVGIPCLILAFLALMALSSLYWPLIGYPGLNPV